ncbi:hypothetical protein DFQ28_004022 [Apophysomyces sp. BC1034]|nr:hypothetical protein DFQ28_004022 [Apophysomyces sp. BC1034]
MISAATANGHVCIGLTALARQLGQPVDAIRAALLVSGVAARVNDDAPAPRLPLVIDVDDRLYLARYYAFERGISNALNERAQTRREDALTDDPHGLRAVVTRYFGEATDEGIDWQRVAAAVALTGRLTIVSGGPGTGKTTTVVGMLACLLDIRPGLRIALAAPTGKAAQRMQEALASRADRLAQDIAVRLPTTSYTLHRLLGSTPDGGFRHHRRNPLPYDVIVVDEASMIDVALASRLVDAVAPRARLILLGDKDQLAAVEAGAVFAELSAHPCYAGKRAEHIAQALGCTADVLRNALSPYAHNGLPHSERDARPAALANCVVWLQTNYRFGLDSPIGQLSSAIRDGLPSDALDVLDASDDDAPAFFIDDTGPALSNASREHIAQGFAGYANLLVGILRHRAPDAGPLFDALNAFRVLCAVRAGPYGADALNEWISGELRRLARLPLAPGARWFPGRPVIVTRNDYALGLFNGDIGIALPGDDGALRVVFEQGAGSRRTVLPAMLPSHDTAFALTVHKSQGSEFEQAALVLPPTFNRALSRELIYTAVTRARARIAIIGTRAVLAQAVGTPTRRDTGLSARLRYAAARTQRETAPSS